MRIKVCEHCGATIGYEDYEVRMEPFPHIVCPTCKKMMALF